MDLNEYKGMHFFIFSGILRDFERILGIGGWENAGQHFYTKLLRDLSAFKGIKGTLSDFKGFLGI